MVGIKPVASSECHRLNKTIFVYINVGFKPIGGHTIATFVFVWAVGIGLNDTGINTTYFASTYVNPFNA